MCWSGRAWRRAAWRSTASGARTGPLECVGFPLAVMVFRTTMEWRVVMVRRVVDQAQALTATMPANWTVGLVVSMVIVRRVGHDGELSIFN